MARILVVDDEVALRQVMARLLGGAGYGLTHAATGKDALQVWLEGGIDLVITDLGLPDMDGLELIFQVRAQAPGFPVIAVSGAGHSELVKILHRGDLGPVPILPKPFGASELLGVVARVLEWRDEQQA
jgi:two-component system, NtrC family, response regulator